MHGNYPGDTSPHLISFTDDTPGEMTWKHCPDLGYPVINPQLLQCIQSHVGCEDRCCIQGMVCPTFSCCSAYMSHVWCRVCCCTWGMIDPVSAVAYTSYDGAGGAAAFGV